MSGRSFPAAVLDADDVSVYGFHDRTNVRCRDHRCRRQDCPDALADRGERAFRDTGADRCSARADAGVGNRSLYEEPDKPQKSGVSIFDMPEHDLPFVKGCSAWLACELIVEPDNQEVYDLFIVDVTAAWADDRVFGNGHWHFYAIGKALSIEAEAVDTPSSPF